MESNFLEAFNLQRAKRGNTACVSIFGAGGKTSLLFLLAQQGASTGKKILVSTTTKMWIPEPHQYTNLDISGLPNIADHQKTLPGITVIGTKQEKSGKMQGLRNSTLQQLIPLYDLVLLETDGAAEKPLKGWRPDEPVVPAFTTHCIGVADISQIHQSLSSKNVHRLEIFLELIQAVPDTRLSLEQFSCMLTAENGLMKHGCGQQFIFLNKTELEADLKNLQKLRKIIAHYQILAGSVLHKQLC